MLATNVTRPEQVTPELIRDQVEFNDVRVLIGPHGYDEGDVDGFLDVVANRLEDLLKEVNRLTVELDKLKRELQVRQPPGVV